MDTVTIILFVIIVAGGASFMTYLTNKSRCTLEEAVQRSGCTKEDLQELIRLGGLEYRRKYFLFGPLSLDAYELTKARDASIELKEIRATYETTRRQQEEAFAAEMQEMQRRFQEREAADRAYMEMLDRIYAEVLRRMDIQRMPQNVVQAFQVLDLPTNTPIREVYRRYRLLAKQHHPDVGGNPQEFIKINQAYTCIEDWIKSQN